MKKWIRIGPNGLNRISGLKLPMLGGNIEIKSEWEQALRNVTEIAEMLKC